MATPSDNPITFSLHYGDDKKYPNTLYRKADTAQTVTLEVHNQSTDEVNLLKAKAKSKVSPDNCHLQIAFPKGLLKDPTEVNVQEKNWSSTVEEDDTHYYLYLLNSVGEVLTNTSADKPLTVHLENLSVAEDFEGDTTQIPVTYGPLIQKDGTAFETDGVYAFENLSLNIKSKFDSLSDSINSGSENNGTKTIGGAPIYASFVNTSSVLNDGKTPNQLTLRLVNISGYDLDLETDAELTITFDYGQREQAYALATEGQIHGIEVAVDDVNHWQVIPKPTSNSPVAWLIHPKSKVTIPAKGAIEITFSSIVTNHPSGETNVYLGYKNWAAYNGQLVVTIEKNHLLFNPSGSDESVVATERVYYDSAFILELDEEAIPVPLPPKIPAPVKQETAVEEVGLKAMQFDGSSSYIEFENGIAIDNSFTIEAWIFPLESTGLYAIAGDETDALVFYSKSDGGIRFHFQNTDHNSSQTEKIKIDQWNHIAITYGSQIVLMYVNGEPVGSANISGEYTGNIHRFGRRSKANDHSFKGKMAEVRVWKTTRTASEIKSAMDRRLKGDEEGLVGYWQLNHSINVKVKDLTSNGHDGTVHSTTIVETPDLNLQPLPKPKPVVAPPPPPAPITDLAKKGQIDLLSATSTQNTGFEAPAVGVLVRSEQSWYSQGVSPGQLLHSVGLAPGETTHVDVNSLRAVEGSDRYSIAEIIEAIALETAFDGSNVKEQIADTSKVTAMNAPRADGGRSLSSRTNKNITTLLHQYASKIRSGQISTFHEDSSGSNVTNPNQMHFLSLQYFEAVHNYQVVTKATQYDRLLFIPMKALKMNNPSIAAKCRAIIAQAGTSRKPKVRSRMLKKVDTSTANQVLPPQPSIVPEESSFIPEGEGFVSLIIQGKPAFTIPFANPTLKKLSWKLILKEDYEDGFFYHTELSKFWFNHLDSNGEWQQGMELQLSDEQKQNCRNLDIEFPNFPLWKRNLSLDCDFLIHPDVHREKEIGLSRINYCYSDVETTGYIRNQKGKLTWKVGPYYMITKVSPLETYKLIFYPQLRQSALHPPYKVPKLVFTSEVENKDGWPGPYHVWMIKEKDPEPQLELTFHFSNGSEESVYTHMLEFSPIIFNNEKEGNPIEFKALGQSTELETSNYNNLSNSPEFPSPTNSQITNSVVETYAPQSLPLSYAQLAANPLNASQLIWANTPGETWIQAIGRLQYKGESVAHRLDPKPAVIVDNYVGFRWHFEDDLKKLDWLLEMKLLDKDFRAWLQENGYSDTDGDLTQISYSLKRAYLDEYDAEGDTAFQQTLVPIPTGGVIGDAVISETNCLEEPDPTRINWQNAQAAIESIPKRQKF